MKRRNRNQVRRLFFVFVVCLAFLFWCVILISGEPPQLHTVQGFIHHSNGSQVSNGIIVRVNATVTQHIAETKTFGPPGNTGFYSVNINGTNAETIVVTAFNSTVYGRNSTILLNASAVTRQNITLNIVRPSETNLTILSPSNLSIFDRFAAFNITFNVTGIGGTNGTNCNASITFFDTSVLNVTGGSSFFKDLGNISLGTTIFSYFEVAGKASGSVLVTVSSACASDSERFENLYRKNIVITIAQQPPQLHTVQGYVFQSDNVTQVPSGTNVTVNATVTGSSVIVRTSGPPGHSGFYSANIFARDGELILVYAENSTYYGNKTATLIDAPSVTRVNLSLSTVRAYPPVFSNVVVDDSLLSPVDEIDLTLGSNRTVNCSANVSDPDGFVDIQTIMGVLYDSAYVNLSSPDDNNNHYTNSSCVLSNCGGVSCEVDCLFAVEYYANSNVSDSWVCMLNGTDFSGYSGFGSDTVSVNVLLAISFPDYLDFGLIGAGEVSNETNGTVTNLGNVKIDISLAGYGNVSGDGYAMLCNDSTNISVGYEKYNLTLAQTGIMNLGTFSGLYKNLTNSTVNETKFNLDYRKNDTVNEAYNATFWRIYLPPGTSVGASCSGYITIGAVADL